MTRELNVRIGGEAGQGLLTIASILTHAVVDTGLHVCATFDYMSRVRGGHNFVQIRMSETPVETPRRLCDIVVALSVGAVEADHAAVHPDGILVADAEGLSLEEPPAQLVDLPFSRIAERVAKDSRAVNSVAAGALVRMAGMPFEPLEGALERVFRGKGEETVHANVAAAREGYEQAVPYVAGEEALRPDEREADPMLLNGNEALALGAIRAGCSVYSAYPMTPSTSIMNTLARFAHTYGIAVEQAEDEIAAINMIIGAWFAGARAMTGTSGGGFALMSEGLSLAGMTETPVVIVDAQRPAPATGFPTRTEQADLNLAVYSGHGEFARVVYTPGSVEQAFALTVKAFDVADHYQVPAIILTDQYLADTTRDVDRLDVASDVQSAVPTDVGAEYARYRSGDDVVCPRAAPGHGDAVVYADSDEHTDEGHITEDADIRRRNVDRRFRAKTTALLVETVEPEPYKLGGADIVLVGFGSTRAVMRETCDADPDGRIGCVHLAQVWPFPMQTLGDLIQGSPHVVTIENNAGAQLAGLIRTCRGPSIDQSILRYDGRPFTVTEVERQLEELKSTWT